MAQRNLLLSCFGDRVAARASVLTLARASEVREPIWQFVSGISHRASTRKLQASGFGVHGGRAKGRS